MKRNLISPFNLILLALAFFSTPLSSSAKDDDFKIGLLLCLSGDCASYGRAALNGAILATEELNEKGGIKGKNIELVVQDTTEAISGAKAISAFQQLRMGGEIRFFVGPTWTPAGLSLAPVVAKLPNIIMTSPSLGAPAFHKAADNIFNTYGVDELPVRLLAIQAIKAGAKNAAIFSSQQPWESEQAKTFASEFSAHGGKIVSYVEPLPTITTTSSETLRIVSSKPEVVFISTMVLQALVAKDLAKLGWRGTILAAHIDDTRLKESSGSLEGAMFMTFQHPGKAFTKKYKARFGEPPEIPSGNAYDTVYLYKQAIHDANSFEPSKVKKKLLINRRKGASGVIAFDKSGCAVRAPQLWKVENDEFIKTNSLKLQKPGNS